MSSSTAQRMDDLLGAIARAKVADRRLRLAQSLADDTGVQIAFQAIQYNRLVIGEVVRALPDELLRREPGVPWNQWVATQDAISRPGQPAVPAVIPPGITDDLAPLEEAVLRLRSAQ
jgi:uncharacterized protein with HEPN domain